ncbi:MAG TPA: 1-deoxy-D-xylulose-5-phosphate synthase [Desulfobacteraceae bacterium]|nr:1-deoxy-D-xylulose-5-phosphate synthase [Desulfobacteraceae bacterium]
MSLLKKIKTGADLKQLSRDQLPLLAEEIRERIISVVSRDGGHLASSLGAVELTIAVHYVFSLPRDTLVWDVGHQAYAHKLLTGREESFDTLRTYKGLTGFTKMSENPCDGFTVGHSSTSISAGLGISSAKHLKKDHSKVISIIGDGSLTAGLAYEGLNQAGDSDRDLIVILNDNDMSISPNVGALSSFLSRKLSAKFLQRMKKEVGQFLKSLPRIGDDVYKIAKRSEDSFKAFITPGMLFEAFNFDYFGPINGHRLNHLIDILENIKKHDEPVLLHVTTQKGRGYGPAENNPVYFHGVGSFDVSSGNSVNKKSSIPSYTEVFGSTMVELAEKDPSIVAVTAAMPEGTGLVDFSQRFPDRFFDVGIAEQHAVTFAAGLASRGIKPVVAIYSTFMQRAYDQIVHDVCLESLNVVFALDRGGIVGEDGPTHHGLFDFAFFRNIPNMTVMAPKDENELARMLKTAVDHDGPVALRYPRGKGEGVERANETEPLPMGRGELLVQGDDLVIIAIGSRVTEAVKAAEQLESRGISAGVVNARFVKPLDRELILETAKKTGVVITVEEHLLDGGFGSAVLELLGDEGNFPCRTRRIGIRDCFVEHGAPAILRSVYGVDAAAIVAAAEEMVGGEQTG